MPASRFCRPMLSCYQIHGPRSCLSAGRHMHSCHSFLSVSSSGKKGITKSGKGCLTRGQGINIRPRIRDRKDGNACQMRHRKRKKKKNKKEEEGDEDGVTAGLSHHRLLTSQCFGRQVTRRPESVLWSVRVISDSRLPFLSARICWRSGQDAVTAGDPRLERVLAGREEVPAGERSCSRRRSAACLSSDECSQLSVRQESSLGKKGTDSLCCCYMRTRTRMGSRWHGVSQLRGGRIVSSCSERGTGCWMCGQKDVLHVREKRKQAFVLNFCIPRETFTPK